MSYYCADSRGYMGDVASINGWRGFREWGQGLAGEIGRFIRDGETERPQQLADELAFHRVANESVDSIRTTLITYARKAEDVLILSDGTGDDEAELEAEFEDEPDGADDED